MANSKQRQQNGPLEPTQTLGYLNNNPTNLRFSKDNPWEGKLTPKRPGFETFATPEHGIRAAVITLNSHDAQGYRTLAQHIAHWAPPKDQNNVPAYIKRVSQETGFQPNQIINVRDPAQLKSLLKAMTMVELSGNPYKDSVFDAGIAAGLNKQIKLPMKQQNNAVAGSKINVNPKTEEFFKRFSEQNNNPLLWLSDPSGLARLNALTPNNFFEEPSDIPAIVNQQPAFSGFGGDASSIFNPGNQTPISYGDALSRFQDLAPESPQAITSRILLGIE